MLSTLKRLTVYMLGHPSTHNILVKYKTYHGNIGSYDNLPLDFRHTDIRGIFFKKPHTY